jgi:hypothetical protein
MLKKPEVRGHPIVKLFTFMHICNEKLKNVTTVFGVFVSVCLSSCNSMRTADWIFIKFYIYEFC